MTNSIIFQFYYLTFLLYLRFGLWTSGSSISDISIFIPFSKSGCAIPKTVSNSISAAVFNSGVKIVALHLINYNGHFKSVFFVGCRIHN